MDNTSLSTVLINAVATIVTTYVVTRLSLGKPVFFSRNAVVSVLRRYFLLVFSACFLIFSVYHIVNFLGSDRPITRSDVVFIPLSVINALMYSVMLLAGIARAGRNKT